MGTRSLTHIYKSSGDKTPLLTIYRQYDGHPISMGMDIKEALGSRKLVNGYNDAATQCNGMGCAAAMLVAHLKDGCGNVYVEQAGTKDCGEEYTYSLYPDGEGFRFVVMDGDEKAYDGALSAFEAEALA